MAFESLPIARRFGEELDQAQRRRAEAAIQRARLV